MVAAFNDKDERKAQCRQSLEYSSQHAAADEKLSDPLRTRADIGSDMNTALPTSCGNARDPLDGTMIYPSD